MENTNDFQQVMAAHAKVADETMQAIEKAICDIMLARGKEFWNVSNRQFKNGLKETIWSYGDYEWEEARSVRALGLHLVKEDGGYHIDVLVDDEMFPSKYTLAELKKHFRDWENEMEQDNTTYLVTRLTEDPLLAYNMAKYLNSYIDKL